MADEILKEALVHHVEGVERGVALCEHPLEALCERREGVEDGKAVFSHGASPIAADQSAMMRRRRPRGAGRGPGGRPRRRDENVDVPPASQKGEKPLVSRLSWAAMTTAFRAIAIMTRFSSASTRAALAKPFLTEIPAASRKAR